MDSSDRANRLAALRTPCVWDVLVIGGGASGLGAAVDAAARGYRTALVEARDFAAGTSSCSTKLIHGGVRYLRQGDFALVSHALHERSHLLANAPHLVQPLSFVIPAWRQRYRLLFGAGLTLYDLLAGRHGLDRSTSLGRAATLAALPGLRPDGIVGGIRYWDGQFDDARLAITLMRTATDLGATALNYAPVVALRKAEGRVAGAVVCDAETGEPLEIRARAVINATGVHGDAIRRLDQPDAAPLLTVSQGIHLVVDAGFLPGGEALLIPETEDGRVMFAIPWLGKVLLGTTDTPRPELRQLDDPLPLAEEIDFLLRTAGRVLARPPTCADIRSAFAGLRPLVHPEHDADRRTTSALSRDHVVLVADSGLITLAGGKWTTYRRMGEDAIDHAAELARLPARASPTRTLKLHGAPEFPGSARYGTDAPAIAALPGADRPLHPALPYSEAMVRYAIQHEAARSIDDILARRTRALFLDAAAATACIERVGQIVAEERGLDGTQAAELIATAHRQAQRFLAGG